MRRITPKEAERALANKVWDLGNEVLYELCKHHPTHKQDQEIVGKIWLIGRSYAAAIERHKGSAPKGDKFYERKVAPKIRRSEIDKWLAHLKRKPLDKAAILETHSKLTELFRKITGLEKRSLASKYLHFHRPNLFFIFDSRAMTAIRKITPSAGKGLPGLSPKEFDGEYLKFYRRCLWLRGDLQKRLGLKLSPRAIDKILLLVADKKK